MALAVRVSNVYYCSNNNNKCVGLHCSWTKIYAVRLSYAADDAHRPPLYGSAAASCCLWDRQTDSAPFYIHLPQHGLHKKSVLSLVPRLTTWCCPHPQLGCLRLLIDRQYVTSAAVDICCTRPSSAANQPHIAAAVDRRDRQTDTDHFTAHLALYTMLTASVNKPHTWNTQGFLWTWETQGIMCNLRGKL